jgi:prolyl-tRNA synthetase
MRQSELFPKTLKQAPHGAESVNHQLLVRAGFMDQLMAGSWTLLPLGWRVLTKINNIIREELNKIGCQEVLMPLLHPKEIWNETGRWEKADEVMYKLKDTRNKEFALSFTHEEIVVDLLRKFIRSYNDLPLAIYHFSTKFRNEPRARSGILRGREFLMKDLYSVHTSEADLMAFYEKVKTAYAQIFKRIGFDFKITEASGGVFTDKHTHEFQVMAQGGEDTIYFCDKCAWAVNQEIFENKENTTCPQCRKGKIQKAKSIEVGNIFPLGTWYSQKMGFYYTNKEGKKNLVWFGSYGIGTTRAMGTWVEVSHDEKGIIWNKALAPFDCHLLGIEKDKEAERVYKALSAAGIDVLWDDRDIGAGEKFADCDLIGIPVRLVVSEKTAGKIEWKERMSDKTEILGVEKVIEKLRG